MGNSSKAKIINNELEDIEATLKFHFKELKRYETVIAVHQIRDAFLGVTIKSHMLLDVFNAHNEELSKRLGKDFSSCSIAKSKYRRTEERLATFIKCQF